MQRLSFDAEMLTSRAKAHDLGRCSHLVRMLLFDSEMLTIRSDRFTALRSQLKVLRQYAGDKTESPGDSMVGFFKLLIHFISLVLPSSSRHQKHKTSRGRVLLSKSLEPIALILISSLEGL